MAAERPKPGTEAACHPDPGGRRAGQAGAAPSGHQRSTRAAAASSLRAGEAAGRALRRNGEGPQECRAEDGADGGGPGDAIGHVGGDKRREGLPARGFGEGRTVGGASEGFEQQAVERLAGPGGCHRRAHAGGLHAQATQRKAFQRSGVVLALAAGERARRGERGRVRQGPGVQHQDGDGAPGRVEGARGAGVIEGDDVQDDVAVSRVRGVAVGAPAAGAEVEFDVAAEKVSIGIEDGAGEIGALPRPRDAREDDGQRPPIGEAQRAGDSSSPAPGEAGLGGGGAAEWLHGGSI